MDLQKIGAFLCQLRKEKGLNQEQLGAKLGVTNKTVSRWENGNYLPPAEMLKALSEFYGISINELLSGERLEVEEYQARAEENFQSALENNAFSLNEKIKFYKKKWQKDNLMSIILAVLVSLGFYWWAVMEQEGWNAVVLIGLFIYLLWRRNQMMIYVENHVYGMPDEKKVSRKPVSVKKLIRILLMISLAVSVLALVDLTDNLLYSMIPELNDGLTIRGSFSRLFFGDDGWSREEYFQGFSRTLRITGWLAAANLFFACSDKFKK